jgi:hypothetical protein
MALLPNESMTRRYLRTAYKPFRNPIQDQFYGEGDLRTAGERKLYRYNPYSRDVFALFKGEGTETIADFNLAEGDRIGLTGGLSLRQITLMQESTDTLIKAGDEVLAVLTGIQVKRGI